MAITWKDAPEIQTPTLGDDYVVRCIVAANPSPSICKLKYMFLSSKLMQALMMTFLFMIQIGYETVIKFYPQIGL